MPFEYAVRPFQSSDIHGRIIIPATPEGVDRATITWGAQTPGIIPTPRSLGVNVNCCNETFSQNGLSASGVSIDVEGKGAGTSFSVQRSDVVVGKKKEENTCDGPLTQDLYSVSGVKQAFAELSSLIHSSDADYAPAGTSGGCNSKTTYKYT